MDDDELTIALQEFGFEAIAFYVSFHRPLQDGRWGVFYRMPQMATLARRIVRDLGVLGPTGWDLAAGIVAAHEHFHFRFDVLALREEVVTNHGLYLAYSELCYARLLYTPECVEESIANVCSIRQAVRQRRRLAHLLTAAKQPWDEYVLDLCRRMPSGYRDVGRPLPDMRASLVGQLRVAGPQNTLAGLRGSWLGVRDTLANARYCPQHWIEQTAGISGPTRFTVKLGGEVWRIHKSDADDWPSTPHAHRLQGREKLDLITGRLWYDRNHSDGRVKQRVLDDLQSEVALHWPEVAISSRYSSEIRRPVLAR